ncbi:UNVERIFIED_CONTAM: hypothetical protein Scaly_2441200 [Sesamum calycinum]|uniref:Retrotransposon gag protein n=1 Tax=Sesamum calycinum TaxID=2727403 RepID=A0AAW2M2N9_9LAMI
MPMGYQPPKFQQFDGKGNSKQHVAYFIKTCNNARTYGDHLVKQFVRSLKDNAFDWYTNLEAGSIDGWEQLELIFDLPKIKRPEEAEQKDDPKYYKYHHLVGHAIQDCFVFKDKIMQLARQGKISLEEDSATTTAISVESGYFDGNKDSCDTTHGDDTTNNEDTLLKEGGFL